MQAKQAIPMVLVLVLAGCGARPLATVGLVKAAPATAVAATGQAAAHALAAPASQAVAFAAPANGAPATGTQLFASATIVAGAGSVAPVSVSGPSISAANGGRYVSTDGLLSADIPPGTLTRDAAITIRRIDTTGQAATAAVTPGIQFAVDLGGASIAPDHAITVTSKVDDRLVQALKQADPAFTPDKYNLRQDANGAWQMVMTVAGPTTLAVTRPATAPGGLQLVESGMLALAGQASQRSLMSLAGTSTAADCANFASALGSVPTTYQDWIGYEQTAETSGVFSCSLLDQKSWYRSVLNDMAQGRTPCGAADPNATGATSTSAATGPAAVAPAAPLATADFPTHTTWLSDDPSLAGKPAVGADVRFALPLSSANGPSDVVVDAQGNASSFTLAGLPVSAAANTAVGPASGTAVTATAAPGMAPVALTCPKFSPSVKLHIDSDANLPADLTIDYTLDGVASTAKVTATAGTQAADVQFYVIVPDDQPHAIAITGVEGPQDVGMIPPGASAPQAQRNGVYALAIKLLNNIAK